MNYSSWGGPWPLSPLPTILPRIPASILAEIWLTLLSFEWTQGDSALSKWQLPRLLQKSLPSLESPECFPLTKSPRSARESRRFLAMFCEILSARFRKSGKPLPLHFDLSIEERYAARVLAVSHKTITTTRPQPEDPGWRRRREILTLFCDALWCRQTWHPAFLNN